MEMFLEGFFSLFFGSTDIIPNIRLSSEEKVWSLWLFIEFTISFFTISRGPCESDIDYDIAFLLYVDMKIMNVNKSILFIHETIVRTLKGPETGKEMNLCLLITIAIETFSHCSFKRWIHHYITDVVSWNFYLLHLAQNVPKRIFTI